MLLNRCLCYPCWAAKCACGTWLTKHAFTEEDARIEAEDVLSRADRWGHSCPQSAQTRLLA